MDDEQELLPVPHAQLVASIELLNAKVACLDAMVGVLLLGASGAQKKILVHALNRVADTYTPVVAKWPELAEQNHAAVRGLVQAYTGALQPH